MVKKNISMHSNVNWAVCAIKWSILLRQIPRLFGVNFVEPIEIHFIYQGKCTLKWITVN